MRFFKRPRPKRWTGNMRILFLLAFVGYSLAKCRGTNCPSDIYDDGFGNSSSIRVRRAFEWQTPEAKEMMTTAVQVLNSLGDIPLKDFDHEFFSKKAIKLASTLKGVSIIAGIGAMFVGVVDDSTEQILGAVERGFDKMDKKISKQTAKLEYFISKELFDQNVLNPIKTVSRKWNQYKTNTSNEVAKAEFLRVYGNNNIENVITTIRENAEKLQRESINATNFDRYDLKDIRIILSLYFWKASLLESYFVGVEYAKNSSFDQQVKNIEQSFVADRKTLKNVYDRVMTYFNNNFWPNSFPEIIRDGLDLGGDNCRIAENILKDIDGKGHKERYNVLVSNKARRGGDYIPYGFDKTMIIREYHDKTVIVTRQKTEKDAEIKKRTTSYTNQNVRNLMINDLEYALSLDKTKTFNYAAAFDFQMVLYDYIVSPCLKTENVKATDFFTADRKIGNGPFEQFVTAVAVMF